jgi:hypothetical protein
MESKIIRPLTKILAIKNRGTTQTKSAQADCLLNPRRRVRVCIAPDFSLWASPQYIHPITFYLSNFS